MEFFWGLSESTHLVGDDYIPEFQDDPGYLSINQYLAPSKTDLVSGNVEIVGSIKCGFDDMQRNWDMNHPSYAASEGSKCVMTHFP